MDKFTHRNVAGRAGVRVHAAVAVVAAAGLASTVLAQPLVRYNIQQIGILDSAHRGSAGYQSHTFRSMNDYGGVAGNTALVSGVNTIAGTDAWYWDGTSTATLGLSGPEYAQTSGYRVHSAGLVNNAGEVSGYSARYNANNVQIGQDAWVWANGVTTRVGYVGAGYTGTGGYQFSDVVAEGGGVRAGYTKRITGALNDQGREAWAWSGGTLTQLGLTGVAYTGNGPTTYHYSMPVAVNDSGQIAGTTNRYTGINTANGTDSWVWRNGVTTQIGLTGGGYADASQRQFSAITAQNSNGWVAGTSTSFSPNGAHVWLWDGTTTQRVGPSDPVFTDDLGRQESHCVGLSDSGQVVGYSVRDMFFASGVGAWAWRAGSAQTIGLYGMGYTGAGGRFESEPVVQNRAGVVLGYSKKNPVFNNGSYLDSGQDTWMWNGETTVLISPVDALHGGSGYRYSQPSLINSAGIAVGTAKRVLSGSNTIGDDGWYYDPLTDETHVIIGSVRADNGFAHADPQILTEDGLLYGLYTYFEQGGPQNGVLKPFVYRPDIGFVDLGDTVIGGLAANGWETLKTVSAYAAGSGYLAGTGVLAGGGGGTQLYVLTPICPSDIGRQGGLAGADGLLNNDDFIVFINLFFSNDPGADRGVTGGLPGHDGQFDNNDFIVFISEFFSACS